MLKTIILWVLWRIPQPFCRWEVLRFGTEFHTGIWLFGLLIYVDPQPEFAPSDLGELL